jgi:hypothetical protein
MYSTLHRNLQRLLRPFFAVGNSGDYSAWALPEKNEKTLAGRIGNKSLGDAQGACGNAKSC